MSILLSRKRLAIRSRGCANTSPNGGIPLQGGRLGTSMNWPHNCEWGNCVTGRSLSPPHTSWSDAPVGLLELDRGGAHCGRIRHDRLKWRRLRDGCFEVFWQQEGWFWRPVLTLDGEAFGAFTKSTEAYESAVRSKNARD